jgi:serine/threonine-protein kinase
VGEDTARLSTAIADRYVIERELGAGGMATVYLAHDVKHDRKVALKVLRPELAAVIGAERFLHEIKVTANLQHPHILALHDSGEADTFLFYVMPYVDGESLRDLLDREKQMGVDEAVEIARDVASALDYAHRQGVIHRDIKPENILLHDGKPVVADFGIALALSHAGGSRLTETGLSIGTPHYMSPEQAMGDRELDARSDVYSLGAMLYEMLAGDPPYTGSTAQAIVAKVITEKAPPVTAARDTVPTHVAASIGKALNKLPADRFHSAAEFAAALSNAGFTAALPASELVAARSMWNPLSKGLALAAAALTVVAGWALLRSDPSADVTRFTVLLPEDQALYFSGQGQPPRLTISPSGRDLVYVGPGEAGPRLWRRRLDQLDAQPLPGTDGAFAPHFGPDGDRVAFMLGANARAIKVVSVSGGPPVTVADSGVGSSASWGPDDHLYFLDQSQRLVKRVAATGGPVEDVVALSGPEGMRFAWPSVLPNGRAILVTGGMDQVVSLRMPGSLTTFGHQSTPDQLTQGGLRAREESQVIVFDLETGEPHASVQGNNGVYTSSGHLVYVTGSAMAGTMVGAFASATLMGAPFDLGGMEVGRPMSLIEGLDLRYGGATDIAIADNGTLVYTTPGFNAPEEPVWVSRSGQTRKIDPNWTRDIEFEGLALSPDGRRLAVVIEGGSRGDVWIKELDEGPLSRLTFGGEYNGYPSWTPDGRSVVYASLRDGEWDVWSKRADGTGTETQLLDLERDVWVTEWSPDGEWLLIAVGGAQENDDILAMRPAVDSMPVPLLADGFDEYTPALAPDGRWIAYVSNESGQEEVYVRTFPDVADGKWQVSTDGGSEPVWSRDGRTLYYRSVAGSTVEMADMSRGPNFVTRRTLFTLPEQNDYEANARNRLIDVAADGRFVMIQRPGTPDVSGDLVVVQNWFTELEQRMAQ